MSGPPARHHTLLQLLHTRVPPPGPRAAPPRHALPLAHSSRAHTTGVLYSYDKTRERKRESGRVAKWTKWTGARARRGSDSTNCTRRAAPPPTPPAGCRWAGAWRGPPSTTRRNIALSICKLF
ncbi:hypothetical protein E2C01_007813 [Portunus trituberculatus]|uniref:Uncharacterized protein n=1 Tax=Portunus trituberculatus TaxID=210409 RepID=A0A5B7D1E8_PORTR|nr:hypothetical protein [Portunus trituberculatus]